jgi:hypothetical protein
MYKCCGKLLGPGYNDTNRTSRNNNKFPVKAIHAIATFVTNAFPSALRICEMFDEVANTFLSKRILSNIEHANWDSVVRNGGLSSCIQEGKVYRAGIQALANLPDRSNVELTAFIGAALGRGD